MRESNQLSALMVARETTPGMYSDGGCLYLLIDKRGSKSWVFRYTSPVTGKRRDMGLGGFPAVSQATARALAYDNRHLIASGVDPIEARKQKELQAALDRAREKTFMEVADMVIESRRHTWRNKKTALQWRASLETYAFQVIGQVGIQYIDDEMVMRVLDPIWTKKPETARRVRERIEIVIDYAKVRKMRTGDNPARWKGHLEVLLPNMRKTAKKKHHAAMPYAEVPAFMAQLRACHGMSVLALHFTILTLVRTNETLGAMKSEVDFENKVWVVPADRVKGFAANRVPLSDAAIDILRQAFDLSPFSRYVFPARLGRTPMSNMAMLVQLKKMGHEYTVHGFRSSMRDWAAECTNHPDMVAEAALAHTLGDDVATAYLRTDLFDKRRKLLEDWAAYCHSPASAKVEPLTRVARLVNSKA